MPIQEKHFKKQSDNSLANKMTFVQIMSICNHYGIDKSIINESNFKELINNAIFDKYKEVIEQFSIGKEVLYNDKGQLLFGKVLLIDMGYIIVQMDEPSTFNNNISIKFDDYGEQPNTNDYNIIAKYRKMDGASQQYDIRNLSIINCLIDIKKHVKLTIGSNLSLNHFFQQIFSITPEKFGSPINIKKIYKENDVVKIITKENEIYSLNDIFYGYLDMCYIAPSPRIGIRYTINDYRPIYKFQYNIAEIVYYVIDNDRKILPIESANIQEEEKQFLIRLKNTNKIKTYDNIEPSNVMKIIKNNYLPYNEDLISIKCEDGFVKINNTVFFIDVNKSELGFEKVTEAFFEGFGRRNLVYYKIENNAVAEFDKFKNQKNFKIQKNSVETMKSSNDLISQLVDTSLRRTRSGNRPLVYDDWIHTNASMEYGTNSITFDYPEQLSFDKSPKKKSE